MDFLGLRRVSLRGRRRASPGPTGRVSNRKTFATAQKVSVSVSYFLFGPFVFAHRRRVLKNPDEKKNRIRSISLYGLLVPFSMFPTENPQPSLLCRRPIIWQTPETILWDVPGTKKQGPAGCNVCKFGCCCCSFWLTEKLKGFCVCSTGRNTDTGLFQLSFIIMKKIPLKILLIRPVFFGFS